MTKLKMIGSQPVRTTQGDELVVAKVKGSTNLLDAFAVAASAESVIGDSAVVDLDGVETLAITASAAFDAAATAGITVNVYTSVDGQAWDTVPFTSFQLAVSAGVTVQKTMSVDPAARYLAVTVKNDDTGVAVTTTVDAVTQ